MRSQERRAYPEIRDVARTGKGGENPGLAHVQAYLDRFGYLPGEYEAGTLDEPTSLALELFQRRRGRRPLGTFNGVTRQEMRRARCGVADLPPAPIAPRDPLRLRGLALAEEDAIPAPVAATGRAAGCRWGSQDVSFAFGAGTDHLSDEEAFGAVKRAFRTWAKAVPLVFREVDAGAGPDILVFWAELGGDIANADSPPGCAGRGRELPRTVRFNSQDRWGTDGGEGLDVETVALHEIFHVIGLPWHPRLGAGSVIEDSIPDGVHRTLAPVDKAFIRALYS